MSVEKKKKNSGKRSRNCAFTCWNVDKPLVFNPQKINYLIYQEEKCPDTGKLHFQGYIELKEGMSYDAIAAMFGFTNKIFWCQERKGTPKDNKAYCTKGETRVPGGRFFEHGKISSQGKRTDLDDVVDKIKKKQRLSEIVEEHSTTYVKYSTGINRAYSILVPPMKRPRPIIQFIWGPPGTGKSTFVREHYDHAFWAKDTENGWFDGYDGEHTVVFDEFRGFFPLMELLQLLDFSKLKLPVKGGFVAIRAHIFIFTSNRNPYDMYNADPAWHRRLNDFGQFISRSDGSLLPVTSVEPPAVPLGGDKPPVTDDLEQFKARFEKIVDSESSVEPVKSSVEHSTDQNFF